MMPAAANLTNLTPKPGEAAPAAPAGAADLFAALIAGVAAPAQPTPDGVAPASDGTEDAALSRLEAENGGTVADAAALLPLIEQQRAVTPAPAIDPPAVAAALLRDGRSQTPSEAFRSIAARPATPAGPDQVPTEAATQRSVAPAGLAEPAGQVPGAAVPPLVVPATPAPQPVKIDPTKGEVGRPSTARKSVPASGASSAPLGTRSKPAVLDTTSTPVAHQQSDGAAPSASPASVPFAAAAVAAATPAPVTDALVTPMGAAPDQPVAPGAAPVAGEVPQQSSKAALPHPDPDERAPAQSHSASVTLSAVADAASPAVGQVAREKFPVSAGSLDHPSARLEAAQSQIATSLREAKPAERLKARLATHVGRVSEAPAAGQSVALSDRPAVATAPGLLPNPSVSGPAPAPAAPAPNVGAAIAEQVLDISRGNEWIDRLAGEITRAASADGSMRFRLAPETLGELRVEITHSDKGAHVRLHVGSEAAQQALADAQPKLASEARAQGVRIAETEISFTGGQSDGREAGRQGQAQAEQPLRAFRSGGGVRTNNTDAAAQTGRRRNDRYA